MLNVLKKQQVNVVEEPEFVKTLFGDVRFSVLWLIVRVWLGWQWLEAGLHKFSNPGWVQTGDALKGFWTGAVAIPETGKAAITFGWYRSFLQFMLDHSAYIWFSKLVVAGELLIGTALILGAFVGVAAFFGAFMNWNFMMAGSASSNPLLFVLALSLIFAWKTAGYLGADYYLLRWLGTPWKREHLAQTRRIGKPGLAPAGDD